MGCKISTFHKETKKSIRPTIVATKAYDVPPGCYLIKSKFKYDASGTTDISFEAREYMYVKKEVDEYWLQVVKYSDNSTGLVPSNYVLKQDGSPQSVEAWRHMQRWETEKLLMRVGLEKGIYVLRPSRKENSYALSVRDYDKKKKIASVKHFQIKVNKDGEEPMYSINQKGFPDINTLVSFYEENGIGSEKIKLTEPLPDDYHPPVHFQDIEICRENLQILCEIGRGCFGSVHKAKWGRSYEVAVKMLQSKKADREKFLKEAKIMHKLRHRKIVELLGICTEPQDMPLMIVVEFLKNGSLKEYLQSDVGKKIQLHQMIHFMADISEGMAYLEMKNVVHKDLRADNILVADDLSVKVADFGLTEIIDKDEEQENKNTKFPFKWTAPEAATTKIFTTKSDVWSFGVVMYEILTWARQPYPDIAARDVIEKVKNGYRMPNPETVVRGAKCPSEIYKIMLKCWSASPENRPSFSELQVELDNRIVKYKGEMYEDEA